MAFHGTVLHVPEISRFYGVVITIFYHDHEPPHFHASYGGQVITVDIWDGRTSGSLPAGTLRLVQRWRELYRYELLEDWLLARARRPLKPIPPLE